MHSLVVSEWGTEEEGCGDDIRTSTTLYTREHSRAASSKVSRMRGEAGALSSLVESDRAQSVDGRARIEAVDRWDWPG